MVQNIVRAAMIGDVVGEPGLKTLEEKLPALINEQKIDFVTVNGENAADGFGITDFEYKRILNAGADVVTSGNHVWEKRDFWTVLENEKTMLRPANYNSSPGQGFVCIEKNGVNWLVINLQGREFMYSAIDCPFRCFEKVYKDSSVISEKDSKPFLTLIDFHAESTKEKESLAYFCDGRASLIAGTHTHVQTADERLLPKGTAYITDLGMTGVKDSVIGIDPEICIQRFTKQVQYQMKVAVSNNLEKMMMNGVIAEIDADTGKAVSIRRI